MSNSLKFEYVQLQSFSKEIVNLYLWGPLVDFSGTSQKGKRPLLTCVWWGSLTLTYYYKDGSGLEFVTGGVELLKAVLHGYAGGLIFMK